MCHEHTHRLSSPDNSVWSQGLFKAPSQCICLLSAFSLLFLCPLVPFALCVLLCGCWCSLFLSFLPNPSQGDGLRLMGMLLLCSWENPTLLRGWARGGGVLLPVLPSPPSLLCHGPASPMVWGRGTAGRKETPHVVLSQGLPYLSLPAPQLWTCLATCPPASWGPELGGT